MTFRFLHLADLHLESGFGGSTETAARLRSAILDSFVDAIDLAIERDLDAVLCAGDLYDEGLLSGRVAKLICDQVERLARAGVAFLWVCGNHDPGAAGTRAHDWMVADLDAADDGSGWRELVHVFRDAEARAVEVGEVGLVIGAGHGRDRESANLAAGFPALDDLNAGGRAVVGLLHTQVEGGSGEHERYAPSTAADFCERRYSYWALGHVHKRGRAVAGEPVWYCGNLMGRSAKPTEAGPKGGLLVEAEAGAAAEPKFVRLGRLGWQRLAFEGSADECAALSAASHGAGLLGELAELIEARFEAAGEDSLGLGEVVLRVELSGPFAGRRVLEDAELRAELEEDLAVRLGCVEVQLRTRGLVRPIDRAELEAVPTVLAQGLKLHASLLAGGLAEFMRESGVRLADLPADEDERMRYFEELMDGLDGELVERLLDWDAMGIEGA